MKISRANYVLLSTDMANVGHMLFSNIELHAETVFAFRHIDDPY